MPRELEPLRTPALDEHEPALLPARLGAELVHLAEEFYLCIFRLACVLVLAGGGLTICFAALDRGTPAATTMLFVALAAAFAVAGLAQPQRVYRRLRSSGAPYAPAALGALAVLVDGPESECWWIALPLLWIIATLSSTPLAIGAATATAAAWLAGTALGGQALVAPGDLGVLPAAVALPTYTLVACVLIDGFAGLVLGRHHHALKSSQHRPPPLRVVNLAAATTATRSPPASTATRVSRRTRPASRLTARQLEVTLLLRDGLHQTEVAACLGISTRQVERLVAAARERAGAATTTQLVAMLASGALAPDVPRRTHAAPSR